MIIVMKPRAKEESIKAIIRLLEDTGLTAHLSEGKEVTIIGVVGDKKKLLEKNLELFEDVDKLIPVTESYKLSNKKFHPAPSVIKVKDIEIGGKELVIMAGPCAVESKEQLFESAKIVKESGAQILRGGAYKPRTSPYSFQGLEEEGLKLMAQAGQEFGLAIVSEVTSFKAIEAAEKYVDILQIGARNMQNFELLKEAGKTKLPVLLKRGLASTIDEWLNAAEYIMSEGNPNVILCERGIRTFETATRNTLDISAVAVCKLKTHLPVIVDPSHGTGQWEYVSPMARAAVSAGADGLMIEVHPRPEIALSDGPQSLNPKKFAALCKEIEVLASIMGRGFGRDI